MLTELKEKVFKANLDLVKHGLVIYTWEMFQASTLRQSWWSSNRAVLTMMR